MDYKAEFIEFMVSSGVLIFGDFTTKSGRQTPYFINTGNYRTGSQADALGRFYAQAYLESGVEAPDFLFGPAYKGIPLVVETASALWRMAQLDLPYCFNRKEQKDHGEGGEIVGHRPRDGERAIIIEDVVTAGTAVRESIGFFKKIADVTISDLFVSVDRMERGKTELSALDELKTGPGIRTHSIVNVYDIIRYLYKKPVNGRVFVDDEVKSKMEEYLSVYGAKN